MAASAHGADLAAVVASAVGEGSVAISQVHRYLAEAEERRAGT